eukprot:4243418-Pleurochrysis_carterae.AAC.4
MLNAKSRTAPCPTTSSQAGKAHRHLFSSLRPSISVGAPAIYRLELAGVLESETKDLQCERKLGNRRNDQSAWTERQRASKSMQQPQSIQQPGMAEWRRREGR